ncbi:hypothetical protein Tco_1360220 [Tanacetum coccineum]
MMICEVPCGRNNGRNNAGLSRLPCRILQQKGFAAKLYRFQFTFGQTINISFPIPVINWENATPFTLAWPDV